MTEINKAWFDFLKEQGASFDAAHGSDVIAFGTEADFADATTDFVTPLTHLGQMSVTGEDAATFLHNQLTNDVEHLTASDARLAGYCTPKGRLLATMLMWKNDGKIMLQLPRELQAAIQKRLQMFVLRAKAKLADETENLVLLGLVGPSAETVLNSKFPNMPATPYSKVGSDAGTLIRVADARGAARYLWATTLENCRAAWPELLTALKPAPTRYWRLSEIHAAIPQVTLATQERFVPQMINFEVVGGVNFRKGCYPGQEIVARSQYLGKLKRRMLPATIKTNQVQAGMEVFSASDAAQPCGMVVNAEPSGPDRFDCLIEIKMTAPEAGKVHLRSVNGPALHFNSLPYALPDPE